MLPDDFTPTTLDELFTPDFLDYIRRYLSKLIDSQIDIMTPLHASLDDFLQEACLALCTSYHKFNPDKGASFKTFATRIISNSFYDTNALYAPVFVPRRQRKKEDHDFSYRHDYSGFENGFSYTNDSGDIVIPHMAGYDTNLFLEKYTTENSFETSSRYSENSRKVTLILLYLPPLETRIIRQYFGLDDGYGHDYHEIATLEHLDIAETKHLFRKSLSTLKTIASHLMSNPNNNLL